MKWPAAFWRPKCRRQPNDINHICSWILRFTRAGMEKREGDVMEIFKDYSLLDLLMLTQLMPIRVFNAFKSGAWLFDFLPKKVGDCGHGRNRMLCLG